MDSTTKNKINISELFDNISPKYDLLNHLLTLNIDKIWRKKTVSMISNKKPLLLDVATGTCDLAIKIIKEDKAQLIYGVDISPKMLSIGKEKVIKEKMNDRISLFEGDSCKLDFKDNTFDCVTVAFGVRNFSDFNQGLNEIYRVLKQDGEFIVLEFSLPKNKLIKNIYMIYFNQILPVVGRMISKDNKAYTYLPKSVERFIYGEKFKNKLIEKGFSDVEIKTLSCGIATIYKAKK
ncbi:MAG: bifunctional demethylmenaquinone methyltransferase/2-methoxy-6-polyprenyl-1,4-benzoquinol methylase UbiE [Bacteroidales bacterium]|jgi:demethylmenaquinone methyltransferase/2-methoxy-6-polyprenyl-1,4-benzoquinol methylase|nr:bifunctional demethylmenaquinone methyltransferase/2-methoxy-6-polyprenyl-1,4-benzoquinol methylase UbiE [Bacteroidales bacterium]